VQYMVFWLFPHFSFSHQLKHVSATLNVGPGMFALKRRIQLALKGYALLRQINLATDNIIRPHFPLDLTRFQAVSLIPTAASDFLA
jgi:hypothetical protein